MLSKARTLAAADAKSAELSVEIDKYIKLCQWCRECLENSLRKGMGHKKDGLTKDDVAALRDIGISIDRAISGKIKYDKHVSKLADELSEDEQETAIIEWVCSREPTQRRKILKICVTRHNNMMGRASIRVEKENEPESDIDTNSDTV